MDYTKRVFLLGFMGCGKTHWGKRLAEKMDLPHYDMDELIATAEEMTISEIFEEKGEKHFRDLEKACLKKFFKEPAFVLSTGGGAPCFFDNMQQMNQQGTTVWLNPSLELMVTRLQRKKHKRPLIAELTDEELTAYVEKKLREREPFYSQADLIVDTHNLSPEQLAEKIKTCRKHT